ncbi:MAG: S41 family peptidase [Cyclobacteriaceae bacterium]
MRLPQCFYIAALVLLCFAFNGFSQDADSVWMRHTSISPDGSTIAFSYLGDIWTVPSKGGRALRLTSHPAYEAQPVWSRDNTTIAFSSNRHGNFDVFTIPVGGGMASRLTHHSADDWPTDFSPNGDEVYFNSIRRDNPESVLFHRLGELYAVSTKGTMPEQVLAIPAWQAKVDTSGNMLFEEIKGYEDEFRKHHTSSVTRDVWVKRPDGSFEKLSTFEGEDRNGVFGSGSTYYFLSEKSGTFNVHRGDIDDPTVNVQISSFEHHPVRYLSVSDNGLLCYNYNGAVYTQLEGAEPQRIVIDATGDQNVLPTELLSIAGDVSELDVSPNGKELAFIHRGEVFVTTVEGGLTRRLTNTPEQERSLSFSPDGKSLVFAGERNNSWNLYLIKVAGKDEKYFTNALELKEEVLLANEFETFQPAFSPDGKEVAFLEERIKLKKINIETKAVTQIHDGTSNFSYADGDQHFSWSPDGKWFAITFNPQGHWVSETGIIKSDGTGGIRNLTSSGFYDEYPQWSRDGKMLYWFSDRDGGHSVAKTGSFEMDVYAYFLTQEAFDEYRLGKGEATLLADKKDEEEEEKEGKGKKSKKGEEENKEKEEELTPVKIEFDGLSKRKVRLTLFSTYLSDAKLTKDSKSLYYLGTAEDKTELWKTDLRTKETKSIGSYSEGGGSLILSKDGKQLYVATDDGIEKVDLSSDEGKPVGIGGEMAFDKSAERLYIFDHAARQVRKKFLDPDLHGVDWDMMVANYRQFVPGLNNDHDFSDLLSELLGELNASHTGARWRERSGDADATSSLGVFFDPDYSGNGIRIKEIMEGSPLVQKDKKIKVGVVIEAIDGVAIGATANYYPLLNRKADKPALLSLHSPVSGDRWKEWVKPISFGAENELYYQRWIKRNRQMVHDLSDNQVGYMHVRNMSDRSFREFLEDAMGEEVNKQALIVDTRFNGGGDLVDDLTTWLSGTKYMEFESNDGRIIGKESQRRWTKPSVMLIGEGNYSDAHCTPAGYKDLEIGKLVGMPVAGTCSFVWWERTQNGLVFGIPNMAVKDIAGDVLENKQLMPDIQVKNPFDEVVNNKDQQIEKAVEELLRQIR